MVDADERRGKELHFDVEDDLISGNGRPIIESLYEICAHANQDQCGLS